MVRIFDAEAQGPGDGHTRDTDGFHSAFQGFKAFFVGNDSHVVEMVTVCRHGGNAGCCRSRFIERYFHSTLRCFAGIDGLGHRVRCNHEAGIRRRDAMFFEVQAVDFFFCRNAQAHGGVEDAEDDIDGDEDIESDDRIVDFHFLVDEFNEENDGRAGNDADDEGTGDTDGIAACCDSDEAGQTAVQGHGNIRFAVMDPGDDHGRAGADEGADTADHVDAGGTGEIMEAQILEPAAAPDPVTGNRVDQEADEDRVDTIDGELRPFCHGARDNRRRSGTEDGLENQERHVREARVVSNVEILDKRIRDTDDAVKVRAEHEAEAEEPGISG